MTKDFFLDIYVKLEWLNSSNCKFIGMKTCVRTKACTQRAKGQLKIILFGICEIWILPFRDSPSPLTEPFSKQTKNEYFQVKKLLETGGSA